MMNDRIIYYIPRGWYTYSYLGYKFIAIDNNELFTCKTCQLNNYNDSIICLTCRRNNR